MDEENIPIIQILPSFPRPGAMQVDLAWADIPGGWRTVVEAVHAAYKIAVHKAVGEQVEAAEESPEEPPRIVIPGAMLRNVNGG